MVNSFLTFKILENGNLRISLDRGNKRNLKELLKNDKMGSDEKFLEATEYQWCNGWSVCTADQLNQISECLVISENGEYTDNGYEVYGKSWTNIHNYQVVDPLEEILEKGFIDFGFWQDFGYPEIVEEEN